MNTEAVTEERRVKRRFSAEDRERLIREFEVSGKSRKEFCEERGLNLATFHGWFTKVPRLGTQRKQRPQFAEVTVAAGPPNRKGESNAEIEIGLPNGAHIWIRPGNDHQQLVELVRGVAGC